MESPAKIATQTCACVRVHVWACVCVSVCYLFVICYMLYLLYITNMLYLFSYIKNELHIFKKQILNLNLIAEKIRGNISVRRPVNSNNRLN